MIFFNMSFSEESSEYIAWISATKLMLHRKSFFVRLTEATFTLSSNLAETNLTETKRKRRQIVLNRPGFYTQINSPKLIPKTTLFTWDGTLEVVINPPSIPEGIEYRAENTMYLWQWQYELLATSASWQTATKHINYAHFCVVDSTPCLAVAVLL